MLACIKNCLQASCKFLSKNISLWYTSHTVYTVVPHIFWWISPLIIDITQPTWNWLTQNSMQDLCSKFEYPLHALLGEREREVVCGQVWWPILGICPLHLTHPSAHSQQWTHTRSSGQPYCGARGAVGGSVPCSRVSPQSWYWRWREHLLFTPPTDNPCRTWESNLQPLGYKSNSLTIRPRLPLKVLLRSTLANFM